MKHNSLRRFRKQAGLSQKALAEKIGTCQAAISRAEIEGYGLSNTKWNKISQVLNVHVDILKSPFELTPRQIAEHLYRNTTNML